MNIDVIFTAKAVEEEKVKDKIVVVIDVLRATSVMLTAISNGATEIRPFREVEPLLIFVQGKAGILKCGERQGVKIEGFDLGNSPLEYKNEVIAGKIVCMTTTNGTNALVKSETGKRIFIASYLNLDAISNKLNELSEDVVIVCAGTDGEFSLDDSLCAGEIIKRVKYKTLTDSARSMYMLASMDGSIESKLKDTKHYNFLRKLGAKKDLEACLAENSQNIILEYRDGIVRGE